VLYRAYQRAALRSDVNLFTSSFQFALAEALDRAIENAEVPVVFEGTLMESPQPPPKLQLVSCAKTVLGKIGHILFAT
jgi:hypothetical protein